MKRCPKCGSVYEDDVRFCATDGTPDEIDVLPVDDRITIERRENEKSPWYYVTCEHGASGWMHGNTIEFTQ